MRITRSVRTRQLFQNSDIGRVSILVNPVNQIGARIGNPVLSRLQGDNVIFLRLTTAAGAAGAAGNRWHSQAGIAGNKSKTRRRGIHRRLRRVGRCRLFINRGQRAQGVENRIMLVAIATAILVNRKTVNTNRMIGVRDRLMSPVLIRTVMGNRNISDQVLRIEISSHGKRKRQAAVKGQGIDAVNKRPRRHTGNRRRCYFVIPSRRINISA